jgi:hypothetical protein
MTHLHSEAPPGVVSVCGDIANVIDSPALDALLADVEPLPSKIAMASQ